MRILVSVPRLESRGGVASYFSALRGRFSSRICYIFRGSSGNESLPIVRMIADYIRLIGFLVRRDTALLHINTSLGMGGVVRDGISIILARLLGKKVIVFFRGWDPVFEARLKGFKLSLFRLIFFRASALIVLAREFERKVRAWGYNGPVFVETTAFDENLLSEGESVGSARTHEEFRVLFLARVERDKGVFELVQAHRELVHRHPNLQLVIAGDGGAYRELRDFVEIERIPGVRFLGFVEGEAKRRAFTQSDVYVFPSRHGEGMPNSVLEAMAFGLPVITTPVGGIRDFFLNGKMGYLTEGKDYSDIGTLLEKLIGDRLLCEEMGEQNAEYARRHFYSSVVAGRLEAIYDSVLSESHPTKTNALAVEDENNERESEDLRN